MTYVVYKSVSHPHFVHGDLFGWEEKVPSLIRRSDISGIFKNGDSLLDLSETPDYLVLKRSPKKIPDIFMTYGGLEVINQRMKDAIEHVEPNVHQIIPIDVRVVRNIRNPDRFHTEIKELPDSSHPPLDGSPFYILNVHVKQDSIVDDLSNVSRNAFAPEDRNTMHINFPYRGVELTIDRAKSLKYHIWRERRYFGIHLMSDEMVEFLKGKKFKFFDIRQVQTI
jgi:hypothetical protein